jgi:hypothetical protein
MVDKFGSGSPFPLLFAGGAAQVQRLAAGVSRSRRGPLGSAGGPRQTLRRGFLSMMPKPHGSSAQVTRSKTTAHSGQTARRGSQVVAQPAGSCCRAARHFYLMPEGDR